MESQGSRELTCDASRAGQSHHGIHQPLPSLLPRQATCSYEIGFKFRAVPSILEVIAIPAPDRLDVIIKEPLPHEAAKLYFIEAQLGDPNRCVNNLSLLQ